MDKLMQLLKEIKPEIDFESENALIDDGLLDSFDVVSIVNEICDVFNVDISLADIEPESFNSAAAIYALIQEA